MLEIAGGILLAVAVIALLVAGLNFIVDIVSGGYSLTSPEPREYRDDR